MRLFATLLVGAMLCVVSACSSSGGSGGTLDGTSWRLTTYDASGIQATVPSGLNVDARFAAGKISGSGGCNAYTGPAVVSGASLKIGPLATTQRACADPAGSFEQSYLAALGKTSTFTATSETLTLFDTAGKTLLVYSAGPANVLEGSWTVTGYNNGKQAVTSPIVGTTLTADFSADAVSGSGGCNDYHGPYTLTGDAVTIGPLAPTRKACEPAATMDQETAFLTALQNAATVEQTGGIVTLRDASGATQVTLVAR